MVATCSPSSAPRNSDACCCAAGSAMERLAERTTLRARRQRPPLTVCPVVVRRVIARSHAVLGELTPLSLELDDPKGVLAWVDDPGRPGELEIGDSVIGLQPRKVIVLEFDPAGTELPDL